MKKGFAYSFVSILLVVLMVCLIPFEAAAAAKAELASTGYSYYDYYSKPYTVDGYSCELEHESIRFEINDAKRNQTAKVVIDFKGKDYSGNGSRVSSKSSAHLALAFKITEPDHYYNLSFGNNRFLESGYYDVVFYDGSGNIVETHIWNVSSGYYSVKSNRFEPKGGIVQLEDATNVVAATATIGFNTYNGVKSGNAFKFTYPKQSAGSKVVVKVRDKYGDEVTVLGSYSYNAGEIESTLDTWTVNQYSCFVYANHAYAKIDAPIKGLAYRLCAEIQGKKYYGKYYIAKQDSDEKQLTVKYPTQKPGIYVKVSVLSYYGASYVFASKKIVKPSGIVIKTSGVRTTQMTAYLEDTSYYSEKRIASLSAVLTVGAKKYRGTVYKNGLIKFKYKAKVGAVVKLTVADVNGFVYAKKVRIPQGDGKIQILACNAERTVFRFKSSYSKIKSVTIVTNNKKQRVVYYKKANYNKDRNKKYKGFIRTFSFVKGYDYRQAYYSSKVGKAVKIKIVTNDGYVYTAGCKARQVKPYLKVNKVYSSDNKVTGRTDPRGVVVIKVGSRVYKVRPNKKGYFSRKIVPARFRTSVSVSVVISKYGYKNTVTDQVYYHAGSASYSGNIYRGNNKVNISYTNAYRGDIITLVVGSRTYKYVFKKNSSSGVHTFRITPASAGTGVSMRYTDCHGDKKDYLSYGDWEQTMVYIGDRIFTGMSAYDCELTTWGRADRKNNYSGLLQWVFESGRKTLYAYIRNGVVTDLQEIHY